PKTDIAKLKHLARSNVELFFTWVCEAALGLPDKGGENSLLDGRIGGAQPAASQYTELAKSLLDRLKGGVSYKRRRFNGYLSFLDSFAAQWTPPDRVNRPHFHLASVRWKEKLVADVLRSEMLRFETHVCCL